MCSERHGLLTGINELIAVDFVRFGEGEVGTFITVVNDARVTRVS